MPRKSTTNRRNRPMSYGSPYPFPPPFMNMGGGYDPSIYYKFQRKLEKNFEAKQRRKEEEEKKKKEKDAPKKKTFTVFEVFCLLTFLWPLGPIWLSLMISSTKHSLGLLSSLVK